MNNVEFESLVSEQRDVWARFVIAVNNFASLNDDSFKEMMDLTKEVEEINKKVAEPFTSQGKRVPYQYIIDVDNIINYVNPVMVEEANKVLNGRSKTKSSSTVISSTSTPDESIAIDKSKKQTEESKAETKKDDLKPYDKLDMSDLGMPDIDFYNLDDIKPVDKTLRTSTQNKSTPEDNKSDAALTVEVKKTDGKGESSVSKTTPTETIVTKPEKTSKNDFKNKFGAEEKVRLKQLVDSINSEAFNVADSMLGDKLNGMTETYVVSEVEKLKYTDSAKYDFIVSDIKNQMIKDAFLPDNEFKSLDGLYTKLIGKLYKSCVGNFQRQMTEYMDAGLCDKANIDYDLFLKVSEILKVNTVDNNKAVTNSTSVPTDVKKQEFVDAKDLGTHFTPEELAGGTPISEVSDKLNKSADAPSGKRIGKITIIKNNIVKQYENFSLKIQELINTVCELYGIDFNDPKFNSCLKNIVNGKDIDGLDKSKVYLVKMYVIDINRFLKNHKVGTKEWISELNLNDAHNCLVDMNNSYDVNAKSKSVWANYMASLGLTYLASYAVSLVPVGVGLGISGASVIAGKALNKYEEKKGKKSWSEVAHKVIDRVKISGVTGLISKIGWPVGALVATGTGLVWVAINSRLKNLDASEYLDYYTGKVEIKNEEGIKEKITGIKENIKTYFKDPRKLCILKDKALQVALMSTGIMATKGLATVGSGLIGKLVSKYDTIAVEQSADLENQIVNSR